jgi:hypothetical protein
MPKIYYIRCERALIYEMDRLSRIVRENKIDYAVYDSIAFACDGPPESAEIAGKYFRAARQIGGGSLHIAHITKSEGGDQKPFGSVFWHNGARSTYFQKLSDSSPDGKTLSVGLFNRKSNLGGLCPATGFLINFTDTRTFFTKSDPADTPDLAQNMPIRQRMKGLLKRGAMAIEELSEALDAKPDTVRRTAGRYKNEFWQGGILLYCNKITKSDSVRTVLIFVRTDTCAPFRGRRESVRTRKKKEGCF